MNEMRVSMFSVDYWLAYGLLGLLQHVERRVTESELGFQTEIVNLYRQSMHKLNDLCDRITERTVNSYPPREETFDHIDNWILNGIEGCVRILESRSRDAGIDAPLDTQRVAALRDKLDEIIRRDRQDVP